MNRENAKPFAHSKHYLYFWQKYSDQMNENVLAKLKYSQNLLNMMFPALVVGPCAVTNPAHWETP